VRISLLARRLVTMVPAILVLASGLDAYRILILSQVALAIQLPFAIVPLVGLTASRRVMGDAVNRRLTTAAGSLVAGAIGGLNVVLLAFAFAGP
jgi:manganese transport protein